MKKFFFFQILVTPMGIRIGFFTVSISLIFVWVATISGALFGSFGQVTGAEEQLAAPITVFLQALSSIPVLFLNLIFFRIFCECCIIVFRISESLDEITAQLARQ